ncbi:MAG: aminotransferase class I/II-fold pyridoxal phosphate-dependent enzyme [Flavobacteriaceae bacterium]|nr:aminotransferase class I/II-fold pyridoxal phosphate-dependent enzyme [Flavobacteriaceae bacterium]
MQITNQPKIKLGSDALNFINLYESLGERAENFIPLHVLDKLKHFIDLCLMESEDPARLEMLISRAVVELKEVIPGYAEVALMLYPHKLSKAFEYSSQKQKFNQRLKNLIDTDAISDVSKQKAQNILNAHDFSVGNPPVTNAQLEFVYKVVLGDNAVNIRKYKEVLGIIDEVESAQWDYMLDVLDQMVVQNSHYTTKAEQNAFLHRNASTTDFKGLSGLVTTLVSGTADTAIKLIVGEVFNVNAVKTIDFKSETQVFDHIKGDTTHIFVIKLPEARGNFFTDPKWFPYLTRLVLVDDSTLSKSTNTSLVFAFHNQIINTLNRVHTKKLGAWANSQMNLRLILEKVHADNLLKFRTKIQSKIQHYNRELNDFRQDQLGEIDNPEKDVVLFKFDEFARQILQDKYTLSKLNQLLDLLIDVSDEPKRGKLNQSLIAEFELRLSKYFYSNNPALQTATIIEGGGRNQIKTYGEYLLNKKIVTLSKEVEDRCHLIMEVIPDSYERTLHNHFHKNFGINLFLERYRDYMIITENEADNSGRFKNFLIELGIYEKYKSLPQDRRKLVAEFLSNLSNTSKTSISDDAQMIIRDLISDKVLRPYVIWNQQQSWEYRDLIPEDRFDINPFDLDVELKEDGKIDYERLHDRLLRIKHTFQLFDESGTLWDKFCDNLSIIINDPHNPTGYTDHNHPDLIKFLKFISRTKITLLLDEAYNDAVKIDDPDEPKWRTVSRYVLNNMANYPKISIVASISTTKNLGSTGNRLGALVSTPAKHDVIKFARKFNEVTKGNTMSLFILVNLLESAQLAKRVKDEMESNLPKNASRSNIIKLLEKYILTETQNYFQNKVDQRVSIFEGSPLHLFLLEELVSLDKLDILQIPDDFRYNDTPFFVYYREELIQKLNTFRINRIFRSETNKRLNLAKKVVNEVLEKNQETKISVVDSDGSYLLNLKIHSYFSYQDLEKFALKLAEQRGIALIPYETGFMRFSVGDYLEGSEKSYEILTKETENAARIFLNYWNLFYNAKLDVAHTSKRTEEVLDEVFKAKTEKDFIKKLFDDYDVIKDLKKSKLNYLRINNVKTLYHLQHRASGVSINAIPNSANAVIEFDESIGYCSNVIEFVKSKAFSTIYENLLPQIYQSIPLIKDLDIQEVNARFGKPTLLKYIQNKLDFQPLVNVLDRPDELNIMREILLELERILFSDAKTKILAIQSSDQTALDVAKLEGINSILKKNIEEILLHFNLPFGQDPVLPTYKEIVDQACKTLKNITGKSIEDIDLKYFSNDMLAHLYADTAWQKSEFGSQLYGKIAHLIQQKLHGKVSRQTILEAYLLRKDNTFITKFTDKLIFWKNYLAQSQLQDAEIQMISQNLLQGLSESDFNQLYQEIVSQSQVKIYDDQLYETVRKVSLFLIELLNQTKSTAYYTQYNHTFIKMNLAHFKKQNSSVNEMVQHGLSIYKNYDTSQNELTTWNKGSLKWLNDLLSKTGVISAEAAVQTHTRIATDSKKRDYPIHRVDRMPEFKPDEEITDNSSFDYIKKLDTRPESDFFVARMKEFVEKMNPDNYRCKVFTQGIFNELYIIEKSYLKYLTDNYRLLQPETVSHQDIQNFVPDVIMLLGAPEKLMSFPQIGSFNIPGPKGNIKTIVTPLKKETDYFGNVKKPRLTMINEKVKEIGGMPIHGSLFAVEAEDGSIFVIQISGDSGVGKSEMLAAMMLKWLKNNLPGIRSIKLIAGDMFHIFPDKNGNLYGIGTEVGDFSRVTDFDPEYIHAYNSLFERSAESNVEDLNSRSTISGFCDISMPFKIDIMLTAYNYAKIEAGILRYDNPENFILYRDAHGERKEKATSEDGPNFLRTLMRYTADKNIVDLIDKHGNYLDTVLDWTYDDFSQMHYLSSSYRMIDKINLEQIVQIIFKDKAFKRNGLLLKIQNVRFDIIKNRFIATLLDPEENTSETAINRQIFGSIFDTLASTPAGQPFVSEINQTDNRKQLIEILKNAKNTKGKTPTVQLGILSTDLGKKGKEITGPQKAAEDMRKLIQEVRIERPDVNENRQMVHDSLLKNYPQIFKNGMNSEVLRYNFYLYQLEQMRKAEFVRLDDVNQAVQLSGTYGFCPVAKNHDFSPILINQNVNTEIESFTESYEQLMKLPYSQEFADEMYQSSKNLYIADGYSIELIQNNMVMQILLEHHYLNLYDLSRERITEKVNREVLAVAKYVAVKRYNESKVTKKKSNK